jgi:hypothetical protein
VSDCESVDRKGDNFRAGKTQGKTQTQKTTSNKVGNMSDQEPTDMNWNHIGTGRPKGKGPMQKHLAMEYKINKLMTSTSFGHQLTLPFALLRAFSVEKMEELQQWVRMPYLLLLRTLAMEEFK